MREKRIAKLKSLCDHLMYGKVLKKMSAEEFDELVAFIDDYGDLEPGPYEHKALRFGLDREKKPKHINAMADVLLACKNVEMKS